MFSKVTLSRRRVLSIGLVGLLLTTGAFLNAASIVDYRYNEGSRLAIASSANVTPPVNYTVRVIYFVPNNRTPHADYEAKLNTALKLIQEFYSAQMAMRGFSQKTFDLELDGSGKVIVHLVKGQYDDAHYRKDMWGPVIQEVEAAGFNPLRSVLLLIPEAHLFKHADGTSSVEYRPGGVERPLHEAVEGWINGGTSWGDLGPVGWGGITVVDSSKLWFMRSDRGSQLSLFCDDTQSGLEGGTVGRTASIMLGIIAHELGHAFDLPHDYRAGGDIDLMWRGFVNIARAFSLPSPCAGGPTGTAPTISECDAATLNVSRYFNQGRVFTDNTPPTVTTLAGVFFPDEPPVPLQASLRDQGGSGLAQAKFLLDGNVAGCEALSGGTATVSFTYLNLKPGQHDLTVLVYDNHGNRGVSGVQTAKICVGASAARGWKRVPQDFSTIQAAIAAAQPGDRIQIAPGTYQENLVIHKSLTLEGCLGKEGFTVIDSQVDPPRSTITIAGTSDVVIQGFTITGSGKPGQTGIFILDSRRITITNNRFIHNAAGVTPWTSTEVKIINNEIIENLGVGVRLARNAQAVISNNLIAGNAGTGIELWWGSAAEINDNVIHNNKICGVFVDSSSTVTGRNNAISGNGTDLCPANYPWPRGFRR